MKWQKIHNDENKCNFVSGTCYIDDNGVIRNVSGQSLNLNAQNRFRLFRGSIDNKKRIIYNMSYMYYANRNRSH